VKTIVLYLPEGTAFADPDPAATVARDVRLAREFEPTATGVVGWSSAGWAALEAAAAHPETVERLVLVSMPAPFDEPSPVELDAVRAKTLLLFGSADPLSGAAHARWWQKRLSNARLEMVPGGGHDILQRVWPRILSHLAPRPRGGRGSPRS
jgi:pimeloyl-ACP methyl ester carboxylesterase